MDVTVRRQGEWVDVRVKGRFDATHAERVDRELKEVMSDGGHCIRLNLADVEYISSAGIRVLLAYYRDLKRLGGTLTVVEPSEMVRSVLDLSGFSGHLLEESRAPVPGADLSRAQQVTCGSVRYTPVEACEAAPLRCRVVGHPEHLVSSGHVPDASYEVLTPRGTLAVGLGAFGEGFTDCRERFGEFMSVGGTAACSPADGGKAVDYMVQRGALVPTVQALYAVICEGRFGHQLLFENAPDFASVPLSDLLLAAFDMVPAPTVAVVAIAETRGLVGAALKQSPASTNDVALQFQFPAVRQWLSFSPERVFDRCVAVVAGVVTRKAEGPLVTFVRPLGDDALTGHFHAVAFSYRALPKNRLALDETVAMLFEEQSPLGLLHLINDDRKLTGSGESLFVRGSLWAGAVGEIVQTESEQ
jgi:anti-anti-sigma factor